MLNEKVMIIHLIVGLIRKIFIKWVNTFLNYMNHLEEILMSKLKNLVLH